VTAVSAENTIVKSIKSREDFINVSLTVLLNVLPSSLLTSPATPKGSQCTQSKTIFARASPIYLEGYYRLLKVMSLEAFDSSGAEKVRLEVGCIEKSSGRE
jgi:hypothetical protein